MEKLQVSLNLKTIEGLDLIRGRRYWSNKLEARLTDLMGTLSQKQQKYLIDLANDLLAADLGYLNKFKEEQKLEDQDIETMIDILIAETGEGIRAAFLGQNRPNNSPMSLANYRRLRLMFESWEADRHAVYLLLIIGHEARLKVDARAGNAAPSGSQWRSLWEGIRAGIEKEVEDRERYTMEKIQELGRSAAMSSKETRAALASLGNVQRRIKTGVRYHDRKQE